jgi:tetratricopeptide (TPR) repeat protein
MQPGDAAVASERGNSCLPRSGYTDCVVPGRMDRAIAEYNTAIRLKPDFAEADLARGGAYSAKQDYARAVADYEKAIQPNPDLPGTYRKRGMAYRAIGDDTRALADYNKDIQLNPNDGAAYSHRADFYSKRDYDKVIADYGCR